MLSKSDALKRLADLVQRIKHANSSCPHEYKTELINLDKEISLIENELEDIIDNFMATRYMYYNSQNKNKMLTSDKLEGELSGRWNIK